MRGKKSSTLITSFLMLEANKDNSTLTIESSSIRLSNEGRTRFYSLSFKLMEMAKCKASLRSQCPHD
jgi:hypothetical protein